MIFHLDHWPAYVAMALFALVFASKLTWVLKPAFERFLRRWLLPRAIAPTPSIILKSIAVAPEGSSASVSIVSVPEEANRVHQVLLNLNISGLADYAFRDGIIVSPTHRLEIGVSGSPISWIARWELEDGTGWISRGRVERGMEPLIAAVPSARTFGV